MMALVAVTSLPNNSPKPPGAQKSFCISIISKAVRSGIHLNGYGFAAISMYWLLPTYCTDLNKQRIEKSVLRNLVACGKEYTDLFGGLGVIVGNRMNCACRNMECISRFEGKPLSIAQQLDLTYGDVNNLS